MISIVTGPPGNGKSMLVQTETVEEFVAGRRDIVTSTPCRVEPWVTGDGRSMLGLRHFIRLHFPERFELDELSAAGEVLREGVVSFGRLLVVEDESELGTLFLWRRDRVTGKWFKVQWDSENEQFCKEDLARMGPIYCVTDEAWKCYNARRWKDTEKVVEFYGRQHRKFGDDWTIVSHSHKDLDVQLNRMGQSWRRCTNYGLRRIAMFRQPACFEVRTFYEAPTGPTVRCFHSKITRLNPKIVQTYDTSAGCAVGGGRAADVGRKQSGLSPYWILGGVAALVVVLFAVPHFFSTSLFRLMGRAASPYANKKIAAKPVVAPAVAAPVVPAVRVVVTNNVFMTGYMRAPVWYPFLKRPYSTRITVFLSDGSEWSAGDGHLQFLCGRYCIVDGVTNWYRPKQGEVAEPIREPDPQPLQPITTVPMEGPPSANPSSVYVLPGRLNTLAHPAIRSAIGGTSTQQNY